jgi:predicted RNA-binding Zn ribbon-like protein
MDVVVNSDRTDALGERLSLAFANMFDWHAGDHPVESLTSYPELVAWSQNAGTLTEPEAQHLLKEAARRPEEASAVLGRAIALREAIYRLFSTISRGLSPEADDLAALNSVLSATLAQSRIVQTEAGFVWDWTVAEDALDRMLWPVVRDAADLLTSSTLDRVGQCADDRCGWLFIDMSRNRSRKWCSMKDCGNRAKARRHYQRSRSSQE